jgi:DNA-binding NtrC family response regulator
MTAYLLRDGTGAADHRRVVMSANAELDTAVSALSRGPATTSPSPSAARCLITLENALRKRSRAQ